MARYTPANRNNTTPSVVAEKQNNLVRLIQQFESQIKLALPAHLTPSRITRIIVTEIRKNPLLAECDQASLFGAIIQTAQLGLEPGSGLGQAYLIPYRNGTTGRYECQFITGYQGMVDLAERSGQVTVEAHCVYQKDKFEVQLGTDAWIKHEPYFGEIDANGHLTASEPGPLIATYAVARYKDGRYKFRILPLHEIEKARKSSQVGRQNKGPWRDFYDEMAKKTAIRRLFKLLPKSPEILRVQELEDREEIDQSQNLDTVFYEHTGAELPLPSLEEIEAAKESEGNGSSTGNQNASESIQD